MTRRFEYETAAGNRFLLEMESQRVLASSEEFVETLVLRHHFPGSVYGSQSITGLLPDQVTEVAQAMLEWAGERSDAPGS